MPFAVAAGLLAFVPTAGATLTLGSDLAVVPNSSASCGTPPCSLSQTALPGRMVSSPVNGTVVGWRVWWAAPGSTRLRVIRPMGASALFLSSSATEAVPNGVTPYSFATSLSIAIGDSIGLDDLGIGGGNPEGLITIAGATMDSFNPAPLNGAGGPVVPTPPGLELALNADIEPTSQFTIAGTKVQAKKGTASLTATLPNPGTLTAQSVAGSSAVAAKSTPLIKPASTTTAAPGDATLKLLPTKATKKRLKKKGKANGAVQLTFTPSFGAPATLSTQVKLKLK